MCVFSACFVLATGAWASWAVHGRMLGRELYAFFPDNFLLVTAAWAVHGPMLGRAVFCCWSLVRRLFLGAGCSRTQSGRGAMHVFSAHFCLCSRMRGRELCVFFRMFSVGHCCLGCSRTDAGQGGILLLVTGAQAVPGCGLFTDAIGEGSYARFFRAFLSLFTDAGKTAMRVLSAIFSVGYWCLGCTQTHAGKGAVRLFSAFFLLVTGAWAVHGRMLGRELCAFFHFFLLVASA